MAIACLKTCSLWLLCDIGGKKLRCNLFSMGQRLYPQASYSHFIHLSCWAWRTEAIWLRCASVTAVPDSQRTQ